MVIEDDVSFSADLGKLADAVASCLVGVEVALVNYDSHETLKMSSAGSVPLPSGRMLVLPINVGQPESAAAYVITREACQRRSNSALPICAKADDWGRFFHEGVLDRVRCVAPMAVIKDPEFASTMEYNSRNSVKARLLAVIMRYNLRLLHRVVVYRRRRIWRTLTRVELVDEPFVVKPSRLG